jgi:uncharacterized membrane protein (UPF0136 family)
MASETGGYPKAEDRSSGENRRYPEGTGWIAGFATGAIVGVVAWLISQEVIIGVILLAATGTALGATFEQSLRTRSLTARERRIALVLLAAGVIVGLVVLTYGVLVG